MNLKSSPAKRVVNLPRPEVVNLIGLSSTRSIRFRYSIDDLAIPPFEDDLKNAIKSNGSYITYLRYWDKICDVGSGTHIGGQITKERKERRAERIVRLYHEISLLTLDALEYNNTTHNFEFEKTVFQDMRLKESCFTQPHHLFCNMTKVPLWARVKVWVRDKGISIRTETDWMAPPGLLGEEARENKETPDIHAEMPINFA